jgi:NitT/TauT family transport system substrate-binding protein
LAKAILESLTEKYREVTMRILVLFFIILFSHQQADAEVTFKKATFIPQWSPQAQFAGYYVAYEKGLYKKYGIDLTILKGGPDSSPLEYLEKGKADFASIWLSTAIQKRSEGMKLVNIGQIIQRSALMLVAKKARGINKPQDINGKKVGLWGAEYQIQPRAFFKKYNLKVKIIPQSSSINLFLRDGVDVASAMWYNEYHTIINSGINPGELTAFFFYDYGLNFPEDGIYTLEEDFEKDPSLSCAFAKASVEGWLYAFDHPDEALKIVLKYMSSAKISANRMQQKWMLEKMKDLIIPRDTGIPVGTLLQSDFLRVAKEMKENGFIKKIPDFESFHKKCFTHAEK